MKRLAILASLCLVLTALGWCWDDEQQEFVETGGTLYHDVNPATMKMREILLAEHGHKPVRKFRAPVYLELYADDQIDQATIEDWCLKATRLILHPDHGLGPDGESHSLGLVSVNWSQLEEITHDNQ